MIGHEVGLSDAYRRYSEGQIKEWYLKGEPHLYVFVPQELSKIQTKFADGLLQAQALINGLTAKNMQLESKIADLNKTIEGLGVKFEERIKKVESEFNERLDDFFADHEAQMSDDVPEEIKNEMVSKEEVLRAKRKLGKSRKI